MLKEIWTEQAPKISFLRIKKGWRTASWSLSRHVLVAVLATSACYSGRSLPAQDPKNSPSTGSGASSGDTSSPSASSGYEPVGAACGFKKQGILVHVADKLDVCLPPVACTSETCPPPLGRCEQGKCNFTNGYKGVETLPQAWATYYCTLSTGGCDGITQAEKPSVTANKLAKQLNLSLCEGASSGAACVGIAASSPLMVGNSQIAIDAQTKAQVKNWGLGLSEASDVCYRLKGPGAEAYVALTDRCGGYCKCAGSGYAECGACVNAPDMVPNCPCVGTAPGVADACCGADCPKVEPACDWCATNNHPHFDVDEATFNHLCGEKTVRGSCQLTEVEPVVCPLGISWPPT